MQAERFEAVLMGPSWPACLPGRQGRSNIARGAARSDTGVKIGAFWRGPSRFERNQAEDTTAPA